MVEQLPYICVDLEHDTWLNSILNTSMHIKSATYYRISFEACLDGKNFVTQWTIFFMAKKIIVAAIFVPS